MIRKYVEHKPLTRVVLPEKKTVLPVDYLTMIYVAGIGVVLLFFHRGVASWPLYLVLHVLTIGAILGLIRVAGNRSSRILTFVREIYPIILFSFMFLEVGKIVRIFFPFWLEKHLIQWDKFLFGVHPTVWVQTIFRPWLTEFMAFSYWSYYIFIPVAAVLLFLKKDRTLLRSYIFTLSFTMYFCYFSYLFLTARGPHDTLAHLYIARENAGFFDYFIRTMQSNASIHGAAFPSSHVAAVWIVEIFLFKYKRWVGFLSLPLVLSLSVSVVYMQYHYAVDSIAGIALVFLVYPLAQTVQRKLRFDTPRP